jgi:hypothetical protein
MGTATGKEAAATTNDRSDARSEWSGRRWDSIGVSAGSLLARARLSHRSRQGSITE